MKALSPLQQMAKRSPEAAALCWDAGSLSYAELAQKSLGIAALLTQQGIKRLGVIGPNSPTQVLLYWACIEAGVLFCPLSWRFAPSQLETLCRRLAIDGLYLEGSMHDGLTGDEQISDRQQSDRKQNDDSSLWPPIPRFNPDINIHNVTPQPANQLDWQQPVNLVLTSGSSGEPKAALHSLRNHIASAEGAKQSIALTTGDRWLLSLPLFHIGGIAILNRCANAGAAVVMAPALTLAECLSRFKPSHVSLVAAQLDTLLQTPASLAGIKALLLGGGAMPASMLTKLKALGIPAFSSYGLTEMSSQVTTGPANTCGHSGSLLAGRELKIEDGQILVKGDCLFVGYLTEAGITRPLDDDGWFATKDKGRLAPDADGMMRLWVEGRLDNMFICGGENLQPEEVEAALCQHPKIVAALVYPKDDARFGALPHAIIKVRGPMPPQAELDAFLQHLIARFKRPRSYRLWPDISATGLKLSRKQVIAALDTSPSKFSKDK